MNRFLHTAYFTSYTYLVLVLFAVILTGVDMPLLPYLCLLSGVLLIRLPVAFDRFAGKPAAFAAFGVLAVLLGVLPLFLYACPTVHFIAYGLSAAAGVLLCAVLQKKTNYTNFLSVLRISLSVLGSVIVLAFLVVIPLLHDERVLPFGWDRILIAVNSAVPVAITLLLIGILLLRQLRSEQGGMDAKTVNRRQMRDLSVFGTVVGAVFVIHMFVHLRSVFDLLYDKVILPLLKWIARLFAETIGRIELPELATPAPEYAQDGALPTMDPGLLVEEGGIENGDPALVLTDSSTMYKIVLGIFITVAVVVLIILIISGIRKYLERYRGRKIVRGYPNETVEQITEEEPAQQKEEPPKKHSEDPRMRMRYQYGEFLRYLRKKSVAVKRTDTCGAIKEQADAGLCAASKDLDGFTQLYEKARYQQSAAVTDADASQMKSLFDRIKQ